MDSITLQNYRCFGSEEQTARLAPLTLLVGPNSTGKTSFLALIRALWDVAFREVVPNFREEPFDLGSFEDVVHYRGGRQRQADSFIAGFEYCPPSISFNESVKFTATFENRQTAPFPVMRRLASSYAGIEIPESADGKHQKVYVSAPQPKGALWFNSRASHDRNAPLFSLWSLWFPSETITEPGEIEPDPSKDGYDTLRIKQLRDTVRSHRMYSSRPLSGAPIRSHPRRTYDPILLTQDAEGEYIPSYLAGLSRRNPDEWQHLKIALEGFGRASGLFDEISVKAFGKSDGDPFQIQVRKFGKRRKGPQRNLIDVGYGVSQALPLLVELLKIDEAPTPKLEGYQPPTLLLQQPEVHLHPQAQAALGTLFCNVAAGGRQLVIETHSDYIIDRVRMDVRDQTTGLKPEDVSILYFEPGGSGREDSLDPAGQDGERAGRAARLPAVLYRRNDEVYRALLMRE